MVSNKTLALFIIVTVIVSLGGTLLSLNKLQELSQLKRYVVSTKEVTGLASGQVELTLSSNMSCNVDSNVTFGSAGQPSGTITISTNSTNAGSNFTNCVASAACQGLQINNTGNVNILVAFNSSVDGSGLVAGAASDFAYTVYNGTTASLEQGCQAGLPAGWGNVPTANTTICANLTWDDTNDMMTMEFNVTIGTSTPPGTKTAILTISCAQN
jgi:hypothetical protein